MLTVADIEKLGIEENDLFSLDVCETMLADLEGTHPVKHRPYLYVTHNIIKKLINFETALGPKDSAMIPSYEGIIARQFTPNGVNCTDFLHASPS